MTPLRTTVLMKTDIAGSTPAFRAMLTADLQLLLLEHRELVARHTADQGGQIVQSAGDGFWVEFPSVTGAAKSAIGMQGALRLMQPNKGDDRLSIRIVIGLGDVAFEAGNFFGDTVPLIVRIEAVTPADEIYLTAAARLALTTAEIHTTHVNNFSLKGFVDPIPVYRIEQRHRTRIITDAYILALDLRGFMQLTETAAVAAIERLLDALETVTRQVATEFAGTIRFSNGDAYCLTFPDAHSMISAAERLNRDWQAASQMEWPDCGMNIALHRGKLIAFRSFLYGEGLAAATHIAEASTAVLASGEGGIFVSGAVRNELSAGPWHNRLQPVLLKWPGYDVARLQIYRLDGPA